MCDKMEMSGEFDVSSAAATVYSKLKDIESLAKSIPGVLKYEKQKEEALTRAGITARRAHDCIAYMKGF